MRDRILRELSRIEGQQNVRGLLAIESGSRAWGFASPDSDYDVRFIYVHERDWYLSVFEGHDVIEEMLPDRLDFSGWDLRKTLRLFSKCNLALNEWIGSPVIYSEAGAFRSQLSQLIPQYFNPIAAIHHYRSMGERALKENLVDDRIGIKRLFYVLRPLLACRWIQATSAQPPTEFTKLVKAAWVTTEEKDWIAALLDQKGNTVEAQPVILDRFSAERIQSELDRYKSAAELVKAPARPDAAELDRIFRLWVDRK